MQSNKGKLKKTLKPNFLSKSTKIASNKKHEKMWQNRKKLCLKLMQNSDVNRARNQNISNYVDKICNSVGPNVFDDFYQSAARHEKFIQKFQTNKKDMLAQIKLKRKKINSSVLMAKSLKKPKSLKYNSKFPSDLNQSSYIKEKIAKSMDQSHRDYLLDVMSNSPNKSYLGGNWNFKTPHYMLPVI